MAICIKTGACVLIEEYGTYLVCDAYEMDDEDGSPTLVFYAISEPQYDAPRPVTHHVRIGRGWYKNNGKGEVTLVVKAKNVRVV